jgi:hypothetical protein
MEKKIIVQFDLKDGSSIRIYAVARRVDNRWQAGVDEAGSVFWYEVYGKTAKEAMNNIEKVTKVDVDKGHLVIVVDAPESKS